MPAATMIGGFGGLVDEWPHKSKFDFSHELMDEAMLILEGVEYPWQSLIHMEDTALSVIFGAANERVLQLAPALVAPAETLHVVSASGDELEALSVTADVTISKVKELLSASYTGDLDASLIQFCGLVPNSFNSVKLSTISDVSVGLMDFVSSRVSSIPEVLRPSVPTGLAELRLKLAMGATPKVVVPPPEPDDAGQHLIWAETKMRTYVEKAQKDCDKLPEDGIRLMYIGGKLAMEDYEGPPAGKEKNKSCKDGSAMCTICKSRIMIANGGTTRHLFGEKHLKKWVNTEGGEIDEVRSLLNPKYTSGQKGEDSRTKRSTQYKAGVEKTAHKAARKAATAALTAGANGSPFPAMAALAGSPAAAAAVQAALGGEVPGAVRRNA